MLIYVSGVNYYLNSNHMKYLAQTVRLSFYVLENFHHKFAILVAPTTERTTKRLVLCKALTSCNRWRTQRSNWSIIGDAICPQSATKLTKTYSSEFGGLLCRHLTLQRKIATWVHNCSPSRVQQLQRYFGKFTSCMTSGVHKLARS